ncbi:hypothetical protein K8I61_02035 [bacterium]|nr:hypothetical protein [bacterium]
MPKLVEDEELNLQDLIFILLFFFIIAQTLIVFKLEKDMIVPPKVDEKIKAAQKDEDLQLITVLIDHKSTVISLVAKVGRDTLAKGWDALESEEEYAMYADPTKGKEEFLESEKAEAHKEIQKKILKVKEMAGFDKPQLGLIADHRARYGTIFQVNLAVSNLIKEEQINPAVKWKVREEGAGHVEGEDELPSLLGTP